MGMAEVSRRTRGARPLSAANECDGSVSCELDSRAAAGYRASSALGRRPAQDSWSGIAIDEKGLYVPGVSMTQVPLSGPAAAAVGLAALGVVAMDVGWQVVRHGAVMAHEGAHAVADSLLGRQVDHIELNFDAEKSGATYPKNEGGWLARVVVAFVGYIGPSSFGLGAAKLIQQGHAVTVLWVTLLLLGIPLLLLRWSFGLLTVTLAGGLVQTASAATRRCRPRSSPPTRSPGSSCSSGVRGILVRGIRSGDGLKAQPAYPYPALHLVLALASVHSRGGSHRRRMAGNANLKPGLLSGQP